MANVILAYPNRADGATLSGGTWQAPLANLQTRLLSQVARTSGLTLAATQLRVDFGKERPLTVFALIKHNLSLGAKYRLSAGTSAGAADVYSSGWLDVWPVLFPMDILEWEQDNWWEGTLTEEERYGYPASIVHVLPSGTLARYWMLELDDQSNADGYLEAGRLMCAERWQPAVNMSYGASMGWETQTQVERSIGGAAFFDKRPAYRVSRLQLDWLSYDEAMSQAMELQRSLGTDGELFLLFDPDDEVNRIRHSYLARLKSLNPIQNPQYSRWTVAIDTEELV